MNTTSSRSSTLGHFLTSVGTWTSRPGAFVVVAIYAVLWLVFDRESVDWSAVAVLATWLMTLMIQRAAHRDTQAMHAKLDELLKVHHAASSDLVHVDTQEPENVEERRSRDRADVGR